MSIKGVPVVWIESKASFGTKENNESNMEQFWGYRNRYVQFVAFAHLQDMVLDWLFTGK